MLVLNDTKVIPARLYGKRGDVPVEVLLHKKQALQSWLAFARPGRILHAATIKLFCARLPLTDVIEKREDGEILIRFSATDEEFLRSFA